MSVNKNTAIIERIQGAIDKLQNLGNTIKNSTKTDLIGIFQDAKTALQEAGPEQETLPIANQIIVHVIDHPLGIIQSCKKCRKTLLQGKFAIGLIIKEGGESKKYMLGAPEEYCCGEVKTLFKVFQNAEDADAESKKVVIHLAKKQSTEGLRLIAWRDPKTITEQQFVGLQ